MRRVAAPAGPRPRPDVVGVVAVGGALGSLARWGLAQAWPSRVGHLPWATVVTNLSGCLLLGVLVVVVQRVQPPSRYLRPFLGVGVLGGFTTFSTAMLDLRGLLVAHRPWLAAGYLVLSVAGGLVALWSGVRLTRRVAARGRRGAVEGAR